MRAVGAIIVSIMKMSVNSGTALGVMGAWEVVKIVSRQSGAWAWSLLDLLPPYYVTEGALVRKEIAEDGALRLVVNGARIEVDADTFQKLALGERLRVRCTRKARAINIDRYVS